MATTQEKAREYINRGDKCPGCEAEWQPLDDGSFLLQHLKGCWVYHQEKGWDR